MIVVHLAGAPRRDSTQRCIRCGRILQDYRTALVMGSGWQPRWWPIEGGVEEQTFASGVSTWAVTDAPATCEPARAA